jgi:hypothetical protein
MSMNFFISVPRIAVNRFSAGSDKMGAVWKLSVLFSGVRLISSSGSDAGSDCCSGLVSRAVLHAKEEVQSMLVNGVLQIVGSPLTKLWESSSSSGSGVGVRIGGLNKDVRRDVLGSGCSCQMRGE